MAGPGNHDNITGPTGIEKGNYWQNGDSTFEN
jgi:hypothetical protein